MLKFLRKTKLKKIVTAFLLFPLLCFTFFSAGLMPDFSGKGIQIVICTGFGQKTISLDQNGDPEPYFERCAWALHANETPFILTDISTELVSYNIFQSIYAFEGAIIALQKSISWLARAPPPAF